MKQKIVLGILIFSILTTGFTLSVEAINNTTITNFEKIVVVSQKERVFIYSEADKDSEIIGVLSRYSIGFKENEINNWIQFSSGSITGYVDSSFVKCGNEAKQIIEEKCSKIAIVDTSIARLYKGASIESEVMDIIPNNTGMTVLKIKGEFIKVELESGKKGYVEQSCVSISIKLSSAEPFKDKTSKLIIALPYQNSNSITTPYDGYFAYASIKSGVPVGLLKAVAKNESGFNEKAESSAGAVGIMQLMEGTAIAFGCTNRLEAKSNIMAGALYLASLISQYNNIELALAAYNAGPGNIDKYGGIPPFEETQSYVTKVMNSYYGLSETRLGSIVAYYACRFVGNPYIWGGNDLENGIDCSGFIKEVYEKFGVELPRYSRDFRDVGTQVCIGWEESLVKPGDIICYEGHVSIYIGNNSIVHAANKKDGIKITKKADYRSVICVRRIFD